MKVCFKDKDRPCNDECTAYCADLRHGVNCLDLATQMESCARAKHMSISNELFAVNMKLLSTAMNSFKETFQSAMK